MKRTELKRSTPLASGGIQAREAARSAARRAR